MPRFSPGKRVIVLGAGATRGATTSTRVVRPPLNADFFTQVQRITEEKHTQNVSEVMADVVRLFGPNFSVTMEEYFTHLESLSAMRSIAPKNPKAFTHEDIVAMRDRLMTVLAAVLEQSTDVSKKDSCSCIHHSKIVEELQPTETIISFNYDCVIDHALRRHAEGRWSAKYGYGFPKPGRVRGNERWDAERPPTAMNTTINLLKLHGSLNWQLPGPDVAESGDIKLKQRLYQQHGTPRFTIIPPSFIKNITGDYNLRHLWRNAELAIRQADLIAFVGFSFVPTDLHVDSLFRIARAGRGSDLQSLVIANPDPSARRRIRSVFSGDLEKGCLVREYSSIEDLAAHVAAALSLGSAAPAASS